MQGLSRCDPEEEYARPGMRRTPSRLDSDQEVSVLRAPIVVEITLSLILASFLSRITVRGR